MEFSFNLLKYFEKVVLDASKSNELFDDSFEVQIRVADERFGDFQANGVLPYAKRKDMNPLELAQSIIDTLPKSKLWVSSIAGPGFINFKLNPESLLIWMNGFSNLEDLKDLLETNLPQRITLISLVQIPPSKCMLGIFVQPSLESLLQGFLNCKDIV